MEMNHVLQREHYLNSVLRAFAISLAVAVIGMSIGAFIPPVFFLPLILLEVGMLVFAFLLRRRKAISFTFLFSFTFISGMTTYPIVAYYASISGANVVLMTFTTTTLVFTGIAIIGWTTKRDLSFLGGMLMAALLALIVIGLFSLFWPLTSKAMLAYSFIGVLVFSGFVLYDFNRMKHYGVSKEEVPLMALNLYLDFVNLFISLLRFFGILSSDD